MSKISLDDVEQVLLQRKLDPTEVQAIVKDLAVVIEEGKGAPAPRQKWEHVIILHDPEQKLKDSNIQGWVVQQKEGKSANDILPALAKAVSASNNGAKNKKNLIETAFDTFRYLKTRYLNGELRIKTKEPAQVIVTTQK